MGMPILTSGVLALIVTPVPFSLEPQSTTPLRRVRGHSGLLLRRHRGSALQAQLVTPDPQGHEGENGRGQALGRPHASLNSTPLFRDAETVAYDGA
jgi:hypothetical protein